MPVNTKEHTDLWGATYQHYMDLHDAAITKSNYYRTKHDPDLARFYYNAAQAFKDIAREL